MSDTPETDAFTTSFTSIDDLKGKKQWVPSDFARKLERERDEANESSEAFSALAWKLEGERNEARDKMADALQEVDLRTLDFERMKQERDEAVESIMIILEENRHLADGDDCTLAKLKSVVPDWR